MKQVEKRWIGEPDRERGRGVTINLIAGKSIRKVRLERKSLGRNLLEENEVKFGKKKEKKKKELQGREEDGGLQRKGIAKTAKWHLR